LARGAARPLTGAVASGVMDIDTLRRQVHDDMPRVLDELASLVAIPSVGYAGYDPANVRASAERTRDILRGSGVEADLLEIDGGHPAVFGTAGTGATTALLYAHHDVQPATTPRAWATPPFSPTVREGRMYGRGTADDKCGVAIHAAALRALHANGGLPCSVKLIVEGEEECSTEHLPDLVRGHGDLLKSDVAVIADGGNYRTGVPTIGTSIRGATHVTVQVDVLPIAQHSGSYGGPLPDAVMALSRMIASLHDDAGEVTVQGLHSFRWPGTQVSEEEFREECGVFPEIELLGSGTIADRTLSMASINVLAFEAPRVDEVANQIVPTARAVVGLRMAPGEDYEGAVEKLMAHLREAAPWGVRVSMEPLEPGAGYIVDASTPTYQAAQMALAAAFDHRVVEMGSGGSIPLVPMLADTFPGIEVLIWGASDHRSNIHSVDESVDLQDLERMIVGEALFLEGLGRA
jgi:acetylornithine deacetylase/succinyl-diaminopimelate desuccinylase-like protein